MKKLLLILLLTPILITSTFSQCVEPKLPGWDKKKYTYVLDYINSTELKDFITNYKE